jgi:hypothetical protein
MQEDFLHYIWQYQKFSTKYLTTVAGDEVQVLVVGEHNTNSGPDFYNSKLRIKGQVWVGTVELHIKGSDWFIHQHQNDPAYNNVILHVVWEDDVAVYDACGNQLQTLVLKSCVDKALLLNYKKLLQQKNWINCENQLNEIDEFTISFWKEKLLIKRLERKSSIFQQRLTDLGNDWEALLFLSLAENFGLKLNSDSFLQLVRDVTFVKFKKEISHLFNVEALLFGQANLLKDDIDDVYYQKLTTEFNYLKQKHQLKNSVVALQFFRLRPSSFPTIRLSQFAMLYHQHQNLFSKVIETQTIFQLRHLFVVSASDYWNTHYTFGKSSVKRKKSISNAFVNLLIINTIIPLKYMYAKNNGVDNFENLLKLYSAIQPEQNTIITKFKKLNIKACSAADSQALIELKTMFCDTHKCLRCEIGNKLLYPS